MHRSRVLILSSVVFLFFIPSTSSTNFTQCIADITGGLYDATPEALSGGRDNHGKVVPLHNATAITYDLCKRACGSGSESFTWTVFSAQFSAWLLPWLALVSQLPFGSQLRTDDVVSVFLTIGSPALAAYSLVLTVLNGQWVSRRLAGIAYPNVRMAWRVLSSLQQAALQIDDADGMLASLVVLPENDDWWEELAHGLDYTQTWSASAVSQITWVIIAYLFTVIDSFADVTNSVNSNGQGVGSAFLWLLPIVVGWLQVSPKSDFTRVCAAVDRANVKAFYASADPRHPVLASDVTEHRAFTLKSHEDHAARRDEEASAPIYNYARFLPWVANVELVVSVLRAAAERATAHEPVDPYVPWRAAAKGKPPVIVDENRRGSLDQVRRYVGAARGSRVGRVDPNFLMRFLIATALALFLQWGTVGGAVVAVWFTPTIGLGCRSGSYILYAAVGTAVWGTMVISSFLSFYATVAGQSALPSKQSPRPLPAALIAGRLSTFLRRAGKLLATLNAIWIVLSCIFQFSSFYDRCYCNSSVLGLGKNAYDVLTFLDSDVTAMKAAWIGSIVLALGTAALFEGKRNASHNVFRFTLNPPPACTGFIYLHVDPPPPAP
ncbi:hypothetical protein K488DRAFT_85137 [Vararia minispora EC-137]|uniref:Uncharacterized protein n=1 Tax=Vararia minispora EC-137 TaxID=1314806 RepID=A0ACB8QPB8_9AGAM|nr:hypothetical protein K488DRAFT_85137 [Vararia minispora EC-137]